MKISFHRFVYDDIDLFKEACAYYLEGKPLKSLTCTEVEDGIVFNGNIDLQEAYYENHYVNLSEENVKENLEFALEIEKGNYPEEAE